ncbi:MAG: extracellular solute-binding protein [Lachnospiraceae bacterium]|nr:extracellular solute-binding protein [Lachnospiraceae bacterium]
MEKKEKKSFKSFIPAICAIVLVVAIILISSIGREKDFSSKYKDVDLETDVEGLERGGTYSGYLKSHAGASTPSSEIKIDLMKYQDEKNIVTYKEYEGANNVLFTDEDSEVTFTVNVPEAGFYNLKLTYFMPLSKGVMAERTLKINGELPFEDANDVVLYRQFCDDGEKRVDNQGNEIRAKQTEILEWQTTCIKDKMGYYADPYQFYFKEGNNTITLISVNEPVAISAMSVAPIETLPTYEEYLKMYSSKSNASANIEPIIVQGEDSYARSESSLYPRYDRASAITVPYDVKHTILNYIGGDAWKNAGQWIGWEITVPEDGFYNIVIKARQNYNRGGVSSRVVMIDNEIPFDALKAVDFGFANEWKAEALSDAEGNPYKIYLTKGTHTIKMEATLGEYGQILDRLSNSVYRLNKMYRKILVYIGASPDQYRDYRIENYYPDVMEAMKLEYMRLYQLVDDSVALAGQKDDKIAAAQTLAQQLERFCEKPENIPVEFITFKDNITALGTAILNMSETKLDIDYVAVTAAEGKQIKDNSNIFKDLAHEVRSWFASYVVDYNAVGDVYGDDEKVVKVWVLSGRDQGTIVKSMIDDTFTPQTGVKVSVEIIAQDALLSAVVAGKGPNVVLSIGYDQPVNYALRHAAEDLTQFEGFWDVMKPYTPSSWRQLELDGGVYGIPETENFNVLFYRKDILEELGLKVPETWRDLIDTFPTIQGNNMSVGIPSATGSQSTTSSVAVASTAADLNMFFSLLYQYGGDMYNESGSRTIVDDEAGVKAFDDYTAFFNDYGLPTVYDLVSRFRSGEMPIGVASYTTYNTLMVSAPEIRGLWDFALLPGIEKKDENGNTYVDHTAVIAGQATMMVRTEDQEIKNKAWEFLKWWANTDTQVRFGREMEVLLGSSARYATANYDAFQQLAWSVHDIQILKEQWDWTYGIREVPGGYYTGQHVTHAIRKVINEKVDPRETIIDYAIKINEELIKKRKEFGMSID